jgi:hypothetical protein
MRGAAKSAKAIAGWPVQGLEGCYREVGNTTARLLLEAGSYQWGTREIHDFGSYAVVGYDEFSCTLELSSEPWKAFKARRTCRIIRNGKAYLVKELPEGGQTRFKRDDGVLFLADSRPLSRRKLQAGSAVAEGQRVWRRVEESKVYYQLTGESVVRAVSIPDPPSSKTPTVVRVTHFNSLGRVDSDVFVRLGNPKAPLAWNDFDTVSDWQQASLVEDLLSDDRDGWVPRGKAKGEGVCWSGTYEAPIRFPKGHHLIEMKIISRAPEVCSIVLSNWKVYVR